MVKVSGERIQVLALIFTKEITTLIKNMAKEHLDGKVGMYTLEGTKMTKETDMEKCFGSMAPFIKDSGVKEFNMDKELWSFLMELFCVSKVEVILF